jgi:AP-1 complex subunit sigma 1/2
MQVLDRYFGNVCELDIIFNFHKAYYIIDELFINGELQESSKKEVLGVCAQMDEMMDEAEAKDASSSAKAGGKR